MSCSILHTITWLSKWFHAVLPEFLGIKHKQVFPHFRRVHGKHKSCAGIVMFPAAQFLTEGSAEELVFVSFLRFVCWCQHGVFNFEKHRMLYCYFGAWLPVCSVQNSAELLLRAPASARYIEVLRICVWQTGSAADLPDINAETTVKPSALLAWRT